VPVASRLAMPGRSAPANRSGCGFTLTSPSAC
jgi:hypothetical protein